MAMEDNIKKFRINRNIVKKTTLISVLTLFLFVLGVYNIADITQEQSLAIPEIESISPTRGYVGGNNLVTINGTDLDFDPTFVESPSKDNWLDTENYSYLSTTKFMDTSFVGDATIKEVTSGNIRAILTTDGEVWTTLNESHATGGNCASSNLNIHGAYGNGTTNKTPYTQKVGGLLADKNIIDIDSSSNYSGVIVALDDEGNVYSWGRDTDGALGNDEALVSQSLPVAVDLSVVPSDSKIIAVSVGYSFNNTGGCDNGDHNSHVLALDDHGKIYAWGNNSNGQLGINNTTNQPKPVAVTGGAIVDKKIVKILAGYRTSFVIDENGKLYSWGANYNGQLGDGTNSTRTTPVAVDISMTNGQIVSVGNSGGYNYNSSNGETMFLDSAGNVFIVGRITNRFPTDYTNPNIYTGCDGVSGRCTRVPLQTVIPEDGPFIIDILNNYGSWVLGSDGKLYNYMTGDRIYFNTPLIITMDPDGTPASCLDVNIVSDTTITCMTTAHAEGVVDVKIDIGPVHKTFSQAFTYSELNVHSITPEEGTISGGTEITIAGQDFTKMESTVISEDFTYTGSTQQFTVAEEDDYILEVWGASGGKNGGAGGYSTGKVHLEVGEVLNINVGESGGTCLGRATFGGGGVGYGSSGTCSGSGGGASDIRINGSTLHSRVIVAGGGGGNASVAPDTSRANTGYGGGLIGLSGSMVEYSGLNPGGGGYQYQGGIAGFYGWNSSGDNGLNGSFGAGGDNVHVNHTPVAGAGGGGWYGGGSGAAYGGGAQGGGGGSGWVYTPENYANWINAANSSETDNWLLGSEYFLNAAQTIAGNLSVPDYNNSGQFMVGNTGNGYARITRYVPNQAAIDTRKVVFDNGGVPAVCDIKSWTDEEIICTTSAHTEGVVDILIGNDVSSAILENGYTYTSFIELSVDSTDVIISDGSNNNTTIKPSLAGKYATTSNTTYVRTNVSDGYTLYISTNKPNTDSNASDMIHSALSGAYIAGTSNVCSWNDTTKTLINTTDIITNNTWGFTLSSINLSNQQLCRVPDLNNLLTVKSTTESNETINGDQTNINFGTKVDVMQPVGRYETGIVYTAIGNIDQ